MAKVNVYLPDDLYDEVKAAEISVSPVCQQALRDVLEARRDERFAERRLLEVAQRLRETARHGTRPREYGQGYDEGRRWAESTATMHDLAKMEELTVDEWAEVPDRVWPALPYDLFDTLAEAHWSAFGGNPFSGPDPSHYAGDAWTRGPFLEGFVDAAMEVWRRVKPLVEDDAERARRLLALTELDDDEAPF